FWEFISGPIHAGTWAPGRLDNTFGPRAVFELGCGKGQPDNLAPCFGLQFFGHVAIDGETEVMTVTLKDVNDRALWSKGMPCQPPFRVPWRAKNPRMSGAIRPTIRLSATWSPRALHAATCSRARWASRHCDRGQPAGAAG